ncbi:hypothetical protein XENORESO_010965 [Xenotaenia resolanae]|uniref:Uncharacterized protein n=1 Tax=Xenotaenia resolanae TaxID=208358 RepID=A0ABV0WQY7_9TELE
MGLSYHHTWEDSKRGRKHESTVRANSGVWGSHEAKTEPFSKKHSRWVGHETAGEYIEKPLMSTVRHGRSVGLPKTLGIVIEQGCQTPSPGVLQHLDVSLVQHTWRENPGLTDSF